jgi:SAM-dependent methyltransferase
MCGSAGHPLYEALHDQLFGAPGQWEIFRCSNSDCRMMWLNPKPLASEVAKAYRSYYTHEGDVPKGPLRAALSKVLHLLVDACVALSGLRRERRNLSSLHLDARVPGELLEIGCGDGGFLQRMRLLGWKVQGIDFDAAAVALAQRKLGPSVRTGQLSEQMFPPGHFDAIVMNHVIEHVDDPLGLLAEVHRILKPGGLFTCVTPNADSWGSRRFGRAWRGLEPPRHINIFSMTALERAARRAGFERCRLYSATVNTWLVFEASEHLARAGGGAVSVRPSIGLLLRAIGAQFVVSVRNKSARTLGEECVLVAIK